MWPLRLKLNETEAVKSSLESTLNARNSDLGSRNEQCHKLQKNVEELQKKCEQYASQLMNIKDEQRYDDYKIINYSRIKSERDRFEDENNSLAKKSNDIELLVATLKKERNILEERHNDVKTKVRKQELDLSQCKEEVTDLKVKLDRVTEELGSCNRQLRLERERNGDLHEKYVAARGDVTSLTENNLDYQHEVKLLRDKLQSCILESSDLQEKVNFLSQENETLCIKTEKSQIKYNAETQSHETEVRELKATLSSISKNRDILLEENSKLHQEIMSLEASYNEEKSSRERESAALNQELQRVKHILAGYEGLEMEYEKNIKAAAMLPEAETNRVLDKMLPGLWITGNKGLEHSIQLTRRVMQLERLNSEACTTIQQLTEALEHLRNTVASYKSAIALAGQPSAKLLECIASQDDQITTLQEALQYNCMSKDTVEEMNKALTKDVIKLKSEMDDMTIHTEELNAIKQHLQSLLRSLPHLTVSDSQIQGPSTQIASRERRETGKSDDQNLQQPTARAIIISKNLHKSKS